MSAPTGFTWGFPAADDAAITDAFWLHQPPAVQALRTINKGIGPNGDNPAADMAKQLMAEGYSIDVPLMVWGEDVLAWLYVRWSDGFSWTPAAGQGAGGGTGSVPPGAFPVPDMSLPIAQVIAQYYPPYTPPVEVPQPAVSPVGRDMFFTIPAVNGHEVFECPASDPHPVGFVYKDPSSGAVYVKTQLGSDLMGIGRAYCVWLKQ